MISLAATGRAMATTMTIASPKAGDSRIARRSRGCEHMALLLGERTAATVQSTQSEPSGRTFYRPLGPATFDGKVIQAMVSAPDRM
jgi:hypothetical protein